MEFSLANLPAVELCVRRAVIKSQSEGKGATGAALFQKKQERGGTQERSFCQWKVKLNLEKHRAKKLSKTDFLESKTRSSLT